MTSSPTNPTGLLTASTPTEKRLLWLIRDLVGQNCYDRNSDEKGRADDPIPVFSGFIAVHAEAIALLGDFGLVSDVTDNGGRVVGGKLLPLQETAKVLKTGPWDDSSDSHADDANNGGGSDAPSEAALARGIDAFFRPSPLLERLRKAAK